jgi:hypothetical protein
MELESLELLLRRQGLPWWIGFETKLRALEVSLWWYVWLELVLLLLW